MIRPRAVEVPIAQRGRLAERPRLIDDGRWWTGDDAGRLDEAQVRRQPDGIGAALDEVARLAGERAAEDGTGVGSQRAPMVRRTSPVPLHCAAERGVIPHGVGPFSPGPIVPHPDATHASDNHERRSGGFPAGAAMLG